MSRSFRVRGICASFALTVSLTAFGDSSGEAQGLTARAKANFPHSDIFVFDLAGDTRAVANGRNVTSRHGYDNQPYFTADSRSFLFARGDDFQIDVYEYFLESGELRQVTNTASLEFSPTPTPDNKALAFVSDHNGSVMLAQRSSPDQRTAVLALTNEPEATGYFAWNHNRDEMLYWSRYGYSMVLVNTATGSRRFVTGHSPPATPHQIPGTHNFSFVHRQANEEVWIKALDPVTLSVTPVIRVAGSNNNYAWAPDGSILMIQDDVLYRAIRDANPEWRPVAKLAEYGIANANRIAVSPDGRKLAIVGVDVGVDRE